MSQIIQRVKGTRDFYPEEMAYRTWLHNQIRIVSESFGYQEYEGPFLEKLELYAAKSGEELVKEQAYVFNDRGGGEIALRPELTPTLARMVAQRQQELAYPLRLWSFGPFWRYEQPQKGRSREFFQWNIDLLGTKDTRCDAELLAVCAAFFKQVGLSAEKVKISVNDRPLMDRMLVNIGFVEEEKSIVYRLIDRRDKLNHSDWLAYAEENGIEKDRMLKLTELLERDDLWRESEELSAIFELVNAMGWGDYIHYDPQVIRGLLYYTGTVFEARETVAGGRAILGGGRYGNLVADVGGDPLSGVGFAMGDVMIGLVLAENGLAPALDPQPAKVVVSCFSPELLANSYVLAGKLRASGINAICYPEPAKLNKQFKFADRIGASYVLIAGPDEIAEGKVAMKDLSNRTQETLPLDDAIQQLVSRLA